jgi:hypothetical protein
MIEFPGQQRDLTDAQRWPVHSQAYSVAVIAPVRTPQLGTAETEPRRLCVPVQLLIFHCACFAALANRKSVVRRTLNWLIQSSLVVSTPSNASIPSHDLGGLDIGLEDKTITGCQTAIVVFL